MRISDLISTSAGDRVLNNGTYKNNPAYNDNLPVSQTQSPQNNQSAPAPVAPTPIPSTTVTLSPAAIAAALSGVKPIIETTGHVDQTYSPPAKPVTAAGVTAALASTATVAKSGAQGPSAFPTQSDSSNFVCVGGGYKGIVAGICNTGDGEKIVYAGIGSPGASGMAGKVLNGTAAEHLEGPSATFIAPNMGGVGYSPGSPGTVSSVVGIPGWSITYGSALVPGSQPATPYNFHMSPTSNPNECTRSDYVDPYGVGAGNSYSSDAGQSSQISNGGGANHDKHELDEEAVLA